MLDRQPEGAASAQEGTIGPMVTEEAEISVRAKAETAAGDQETSQ